MTWIRDPVFLISTKQVRVKKSVKLYYLKFKNSKIYGSLIIILEFLFLIKFYFNSSGFYQGGGSREVCKRKN